MSYNHRKSGINRDEVFRLIESKQEKVAKETQLWGPDIIKKQMEEDLARRVREALETPPLERMQRKKERDQLQRQRELQKQNSHLLIRLNSTDNAQFQKWRENKNRLSESPSMAYSSPSPSDYLFRDQLSKSNQDEYPGVFGLENFSEGIKNIRDIYSSTVERFPPIKPRARHFYTKDGFLQILKNGNLPDGFQVIDDSGNYVDKYGVIRSEHGPFWPTELVPLFPAPKLLNNNNIGVEPLYFQLPVATTTIDKQHSPYTGRWRGMLVVYDSERSQRDHAPQPVPEGCCPNLVFESRFECGNLRQARRVGQYEYELVLRTDLYTNRHTQWYYFRVTNAVPGITYKFRIVNLLKRDSLYNYGMRPLVYSEKDAKELELGWRRTGHHISYCNNIVHHTCPLLQRGISYYMLEWQMEFPNSDDTYYLAHCYPYTFTDLKNDLDSILSDPVRQPFINREVMCESRAGNSCFLLTITNPEYNMCKRKKKYVVITARVHPGETQASWMMRGLLYFITSNDTTAQELRNNCIFKIVPMINPDGVIVGNYRCSLAARDLNRNYRHPKRENFPTIFTIKNMIDDLLNKNEVVLYCDLHGHSRKQNVFMYGNNKIINQDSPTGVDAVQSFIAERLFPWLMAVKSPEKFSFKSCKFQIKRCKESTGRVVMWRQMKIPNSFTLEATFSGTILDKTSCRHFNCRDYEDMGKTLCEVVLDYQNMQENKGYQMEVVMDLTRAITHQILANRGLVPKHVQLTDVQSDKVFDSGISVEGSDMSTGSQTDTEKISEVTTEIVTNQKSALVIHNNRQSDNKSKERKSSNKENKLLLPDDSSVVKTPSKGDNCSNIDLQKVMDMSSMKSLDDCLNLLAELNVCQAVLESDSSDSDSESEPEMKPPEIKQRKKKRKSRKQRDRENKKLLNERRNSDNNKKPSALPVIAHNDSQPVAMTTNTDTITASNVVNIGKKQSSTGSERLQKVSVNNTQFISKYEGRSNGGVPCFTEERSMERAAKRMAELRRRSEDEKEQELTFYYCEDEFCQYPSTVSNFQLQRSATEDEFNKRINMALHEGTSNLTQTLVGNNVKTAYTHAADQGISIDRPPTTIHQSQSFSLPITFPLVSNSYHNHYIYPDVSFSDESENELESKQIPLAVRKSPYQYDTPSSAVQSITQKRHIRTGPVLRSLPPNNMSNTPPLVTSSLLVGKSAGTHHSYKNNSDRSTVDVIPNTTLIGSLRRPRQSIGGD